MQLTKDTASLVADLCVIAWKSGSIRDPQLGAKVEELRLAAEAFIQADKAKEPKP